MLTAAHGIRVGDTGWQWDDSIAEETVGEANHRCVHFPNKLKDLSLAKSFCDGFRVSPAARTLPH